MNMVDLEQTLKKAAIPLSADEVLARIRAVASAPVSLVEGVALDMIVPGIDAPENAEVRTALGQMVDETIEAYDREIRVEQGAARVTLLREELRGSGLDGFVVPMADEHQNEYIPRHAQRLAWLSGFQGSAGTIIVLADRAAIFVDGRYTLQVRDQVDLVTFEPLAHDKVPDWLKEHLGEGRKLGYDPWLHSVAGVETLARACKRSGATLEAVEKNPIDTIWTARPPEPLSRIVPHDLQFAGENSASKRTRIAEIVEEAEAGALVLSGPDSIGWLLNIRGADVARTPLALSFAVLMGDGRVELFADERKCESRLNNHLGPEVDIRAPTEFEGKLKALGADGCTVMVDPKTIPARIQEVLEVAGANVIRKPDPCQKAKAVKNEVELNGTRAAHRRDGAALVQFLAWLSHAAPGGDVDELTAESTLEDYRRDNEFFRDLSFDTIAGSGPNGAIVHYRAEELTNRKLRDGELFLLDSGAQYLDGTTDVTRTVAIGTPSPEQRDRFTRVLKGHIALATARFPKGTTGHQLDVLARQALWQKGLDFKHGTGHGVGSYLGVHEGPHSISPRPNDTGLEPGMIVSNEPGFYKEGAYGIRIENLITVVAAEVGDSEDDPFFEFETLTLAPIDLSLVDTALLTPFECDWLNSYHATVIDSVGPLVDGETQAWLKEATRRI